MFLNEATIDSVLLATIEQFKDQATNRLLIAALEEHEDSGTSQKEDVKETPDYNKQIWNVKVENKYWISVASVLSHIDTKYLKHYSWQVPGSVLTTKYTSYLGGLYD